MNDVFTLVKLRDKEKVRLVVTYLANAGVDYTVGFTEDEPEHPTWTIRYPDLCRDAIDEIANKITVRLNDVYLDGLLDTLCTLLEAEGAFRKVFFKIEGDYGGYTATGTAWKEPEE